MYMIDICRRMNEYPDNIEVMKIIIEVDKKDFLKVPELINTQREKFMSLPLSWEV